MRKSIKIASGFLAAFSFAATSFAVSLLPKEIEDIFKLPGPQGTGLVSYIVSRLQLALLIALGGIVLISVVYALFAAYKYIRSEGESGKMEEAQKSIKAIFFGIASMLIAIVGIVLVFVIFGSSPISPVAYQTCFQSPDSVGCEVCQTEGLSDTNQCGLCENAYAKISSDPKFTNYTNDQIFKDLINNAVDPYTGTNVCVDPSRGGAVNTTDTQ